MKDSINSNNVSSKLIALIVTVVLATVMAGMLAACGQGASSSSASNAATMTVNLKVDATDHDAGMLYDGDISIAEGATVYDALIESALDLDVSSMSGSVYIDGIGGIVASKVSPVSGWLYEVNGESPSVGVDSYELHDGDKIVMTFYEDAMSQVEG